MGIWERLNNPSFDPVEFDGIKMQAGLNSFTLTPKRWIERTRAIGIVSRTVRYGGTFAFEFAAWISVEFKLYLIKEFQLLKQDEQAKLGWTVKRELAAVNYRIHTDAIKKNLIPKALNKTQVNLVYASEADVLNMALFGMTARQWREANSGANGPVENSYYFYLHSLNSMYPVVCIVSIGAMGNIK